MGDDGICEISLGEVANISVHLTACTNSHFAFDLSIPSFALSNEIYNWARTEL